MTTSSLLVNFRWLRDQAWLDTESLEKEILRFGDVRDLLGEGSHSLKLAAGGREIVFVGGHGFGGSHYFLRLAAKELSKDLGRRWGWPDGA